MESARYRAFLLSAETGSFSRAAEAMNYTPSGVSQLVTALEDDLSLSLLRRNKKGVFLTTDGELLLPLVRELLAQENRIYQMASEINGLLAGAITVGSYFGVASHWLPRVIRVFEAAYPQVKIRMMEGTRQEIVQWLNAKIVDVAFCTYRDPMPYDWIPLAEDPMLAILPQSHPYANSKTYPLKNCSLEHFIMPSKAQDEDITEMLQRNGLKPEVYFSTIENFTTIAMVEQGLGMSIMNELVTLGWQGNVSKIPLDPPQHITLGIAIPSLEKAPPPVKRFIKYAVEMLTQEKHA